MRSIRISQLVWIGLALGGESLRSILAGRRVVVDSSRGAAGGGGEDAKLVSLQGGRTDRPRFYRHKENLSPSGSPRPSVWTLDSGSRSRGMAMAWRRPVAVAKWSPISWFPEFPNHQHVTFNESRGKCRLPVCCMKQVNHQIALRIVVGVANDC